ncbi:MAG: IPT/TIG domain-containing protein [Nitrospirae bacterium]|nr:IPT/TIG domain-containing protein [Nitrospirota bacterium]MBI3352681.1 IPT/TIG domain-containing protein [Nitrospirota bacterium]
MMTRIKRVGFLFFSLNFLLFLVSTELFAQQNPQKYFYDNLGRLQAVVDGQGNTAIYNYDQVGNLLSITNSLVSATGVSISYFNPVQGGVGVTVDIYGSGFSTTPNNNIVTFNGTSASVLSSTNTHIVTSVPSGATTGKIHISNSNGSTTSANAFVISQGVSVSINPPYYTLAVGGTLQFQATVTGTVNTRVLWSIEGPGSISSDGLYATSVSITQSAKILVHARSVVDFNQVATAIIELVPFGTMGPYLSPPLSVAIAQPPVGSTPDLFLSSPLSVAIAQPPVGSTPDLFLSSPLSVAIAQSSLSAPPELFLSTPLSVSLTPLINSISPMSAPAGSANLTITITGTGLSGATDVSFLLNGAVDSNLTSSNILVDSSGSSLTVVVKISNSATSGYRIVQISTPNGNSPATVLNGNIFTVN